MSGVFYVPGTFFQLHKIQPISRFQVCVTLTLPKVLITLSISFLRSPLSAAKQNMIAYQKENNVKAAAVIGGGLLGLEAAKAMYDLGMETHIIEYAPILMCRQVGAVTRDDVDNLKRHGPLDGCRDRPRCRSLRSCKWCTADHVL